MNQSGAMQNLKGLEYSLPKVIVSRTCGGSRKSSFSVDIYIYIYIYIYIWLFFVFKIFLFQINIFFNIFRYFNALISKIIFLKKILF